MLALILGILVAISALGNEATHPVVFFLYRSLLFGITLWCARDIVKTGGTVCPRFLALGALASFLMLQSFLWNPGTNFEGFHRWYRVMLFAATFVVLAAYTRNQPARAKYRALWTIIAIQCIFLFVALLVERAPITGGFINRNYFASFLLVGFSACLAIALFQTGWRIRAISLGGALFLYFGMIQAFSRGATLAAMLVAGIALLRYKRTVSLSTTAIMLALAGLALAGALASPALIAKFADFGETNPMNYLRPKVWLAALQIIGNDPVFGIGLGEFFHVSRQYPPAIEGTVARYPERAAIAHSEYLQYAAEGGLPATILFLVLAGYAMWLASKRAGKMSGELRILQEAGILSAAGLAAHGVVDNNWTVPVMAAGVAVVSLADVLPTRPWNVSFSWTPAKRILTATAVFVLYMHSTVIPAAGFWFQHLGHRALAARDYAGAESAYRIAAAIVPGGPTFLNSAGAIYFEMYRQSHDKRRLNQAEGFFKRAMIASPNAEEPRRQLHATVVERLTGDPVVDREIYLRIVETARDLLRLDPFNPFTRRGLAEALYNAGLRDEAESELMRAMEIEPNYVPGYLRMAEWHTQDGRAEEGEALKRKAIEIAVRYRDFKTDLPYETLLLGRPQ